MPSAAPSRARNRPDSIDRSVRIAPLAAACSHHQRVNRRHCNASARRGGSDSRSISNRARRRAIRPPPARPPHRFGARRLCHRRPRQRPRRFAAARALPPHHSAQCRPRRIRRSGCYSLTMPPHHQQHSMPKPARSCCLAGVGLNSIQSVRSPRRPRRIIFCSTSSRALQSRWAAGFGLFWRGDTSLDEESPKSERIDYGRTVQRGNVWTLRQGASDTGPALAGSPSGQNLCQR